MNLQAINFRSPITWVVIIGGGIAVYFLYRHFAGSGNTNATSTNASGATPYPPTNTYVIEEPPETEPAPPKPSPTPNPVPKTITYAQLVADAKKANVSINHEWEQFLAEGFTVTNVPKGVTPPAPDTTEGKGGFLGPPEKMPKGGGIDYFVHTSTWPYGGQMVRPRLG